MTDEEYLKNLTISKLLEICEKEKLQNIPKRVKKQELIDFMLKNIPSENLKKYENDHNEKENERGEEKHEEIKEKVPETQTFVRERVIVELQKHRIHRILINELSEKLGEKIPTGKGVQLYDGMSDKMLQTLDKLFLNGNEEEDELVFSMICSNWLIFKAKEIERLKTDYPVEGSEKIGALAFDVENLPYIIAEFNSGNEVNENNLNKIIEKATKILDKYGKDIAKKYKEAWIRIYIFAKGEKANDFLKLIKNNKSIDEYGEMHIKRGIFKTDYNLKFNVYAVNDGKFHGLLF